MHNTFVSVDTPQYLCMLVRTVLMYVGMHRPEINVRDTAFKRGTAYLERYCLLIAFTSFLERTKGSDITFKEWMSARPDVFQAKEAIHQNPAGALAPVPLMGLPLLLERMGRQGSQEVPHPAHSLLTMWYAWSHYNTT